MASKYVDATSFASTSVRRNVPAGNFRPPPPLNILNLAPPPPPPPPYFKPSYAYEGCASWSGRVLTHSSKRMERIYLLEGT